MDLAVDNYSYRLYESEKGLKIQGHGAHIFSVNHTITYTGQYTMHCTIKANADNRAIFIKKVYKFTAIAPFMVTSHYHLYNNITFVQACITNCSERSLTLLDAKLNCIGSNWKIITPKVDTYLHYFKPMDTYNLIIQLHEINHQDALNTIYSLYNPQDSTNITPLQSNKSSSSSTSDSTDGFTEPNSTILLSLNWISECSGQCKFTVPLEIQVVKFNKLE